MNRRIGIACALALALFAGAPPVSSQETDLEEEELISIDFRNEEISTVIELLANMTGRNFIYDDRVRGRVTIVSPTKIPVDQAYAVFESVLQVKGFTTVLTPGGAYKVIPLRDAKETNVETVISNRPPPNRDRFMTRLIPLRYIQAESIVNTLKPLVSKDAAMAAYGPTNTVILTESGSNIRRILAILEAIDIETYKEELAVIKLDYADAATLATQISEIFSAVVTAGAGAAAPRARGRRSQRSQPAASVGTPTTKIRIITDDRTNSLIVLAARTQLAEVRSLVSRLDVPVTGGGRIHVYFLQHADAEDLAQTLSSLVSGRAAPTGGGQGGGGGGQAQALRTTVSGLAGGVSVTADAATNALIIQASLEGYEVVRGVIDKLDVERPQVLVEALVMEVDITDKRDLGFNGLYRMITGNVDITFAQLSDGAAAAALGMGGITAPLAAGPGSAFLSNSIFDTINETDPDGDVIQTNGSIIQGIVRASARDAGSNIISAPHILTMDNEEAELRIGNNIPIITSRVQSAAGVEVGLSSSVNVERQDIGVTLRVTPQITEGDTVRLEIFQELTAPNTALSILTGDPEEVGISLSSRRIENTVVVNNGETIVIGGLISNRFEDDVTQVPWLGKIPILGWLFKSTSKSLEKVNLLVFLTPHIMRSAEDLELQTIRKREEFAATVGDSLVVTELEREVENARYAQAQAEGQVFVSTLPGSPARRRLFEHRLAYPSERMREIEQQQQQERDHKFTLAAAPKPTYTVQAAVLGDERTATETLMELVDAGYDGTLVSGVAGDVVLFEIRLGPYESLAEAQQVGEIVRRSHGLAPAVVVHAAPAP